MAHMTSSAPGYLILNKIFAPTDWSTISFCFFYAEPTWTWDHKQRKNGWMNGTWNMPSHENKMAVAVEYLF